MEAVGRLHKLKDSLSLALGDLPPFVRNRLIGVLALLAMASVINGLGPLGLKLTVDAFAGKESTGAIPVMTLLCLYILSLYLARAITEIRGLLYARAEKRVMRTLSERLFAHVMRLPLRFHQNRQTGAVSQTLANGLQGCQLVLHTLVFTILPVGIELGTMVFVLSRLNQPVLLLLFCAALVAYAIVFGFAARRIMAAARRASAAQVDANAAMTDTILNYETVKLFGAEQLVQKRVATTLARTESEWFLFYRLFAVNGLATATTFAAFMAATLLHAAYQVQHNRITLGTFVLVNTYMLQIVRPVEMLGYALQSFSQGLAFLEKMLELLREAPEPETGRATALPGRGGLEFECVSAAYRPDRAILKDVSFRLAAGKALGVVGASGAGKSTIVRLLVRLLEPDSGRILLDGVPIAELSLATLRGAVAVVPQDTVLFNDTIAFNIGFGAPGSTREQIERAAKVAHLHEFVMSLPDGYETRVGERGVKLSGGERQRVAIARAVLKRPTIFVFDEATSSLDSRTEKEILQNLLEVSSRTTTIVIAHRLSTVVHADEILVLEDGVVAERGTHAALLRGNGRYAELWRAQQSEPVAA